MLRIITIIVSIHLLCISVVKGQCNDGGTGGGFWPGNVNPPAGTFTQTGTIQGTVSVRIDVVGGASNNPVVRPVWNRSGTTIYNSVTWRSLRMTRGSGGSFGHYTSYKLSSPLPPTAIHFMISDIRGDAFGNEAHIVKGFLNGSPVTPNFENLVRATVTGNRINGPSNSTTDGTTQGSGRIFFAGPVDSVVFESVALGDFIFIDLYSRCEIILPFSLSSFEARVEKNANLLFWAAAAAWNFREFIVQKSADGAHWIDIGARERYNNNSEEGQYNFFDVTPFAGLNYYRLKSVDFDGNVNYSSILRVNRSGKNNPGELITLNRNPFREDLLVNSNIEGILSVYSQDGKLMINRKIAKGNVYLNSHNWSPGIYFVRMISNSGSQQTLQAIKN